jgi:hypothetical protein
MRRVERFIFAPESARRLASLRIGLCLLLAARLAIRNYTVVAGQPEALFQPLSYMKLFPQMPPHDVAVTLQVVGIAAALLAAAGLWIRGSLPLAFVCALILNGMLNSTGKVIHNDVPLTLCLLPLALYPRATAQAWTLAGPLGLRRGRRPDGSARGEAFGWPVRLAMVTIALAYFFVGFQKLRYSGIDWATADNLRWVLYASSDSQAHPNTLALFVADRAWLAHLFAAGTMVVELGFPLVLFWPRSRWFFIPGAILLHLGIGLTMKLDYSSWALTDLIVFVNWPAVVDRLRAALDAPRFEPSSASERAA